MASNTEKERGKSVLEDKDKFGKNKAKEDLAHMGDKPKATAEEKSKSKGKGK